MGCMGILKPDSQILRLQCVCVAYFFHTVIGSERSSGCGPAVRSRSGGVAAVQLSFPHRVYFCCAACAELK